MFNNYLNVNFDYNILPRNTKIADNTIEVADLIMKNTFFESPQLDTIEFGKKFNWDYQHSNSANTYQLYLHSLNTISFLTDAYLVSKDIKYLNKAYSILKDWQGYNKTYCKEKKIYVWSDHAATYRTINIMYFYLVANKLIKINSKEIYNILLEHLDFLNNFQYYTNDNHGIMLDKTLLIASYILNDTTLKNLYYNKSFYRLREAFFRDFTKKGVHLENSIDYHSIVERLFKGINNFLVSVGTSLGEDITSILYSEDDYINYAEKPDYRLPLIGDTSGTQKNSFPKCYGNFIDTEAGIAILQEKNNEQPDKSLWLCFIAGYNNVNHKHKDDLSILLYNKGYDLFVDSGKYNYERKNPIRRYCKSIAAHNTIQIGSDLNGYDILPNVGFKNKPHITDFFQAKEYIIIKGVNPTYPKAHVERTIVFIKSSILVVYDAIKCNGEENCIQSFNLAPNMTYKEISKNKFMFSIEDYNIMYEQHNKVDEIQFKEADKNVPQAIISETFNTLTDITQVKANKKGVNNFFLTSINLEPEQYTIKYLNVNDEKRLLTIHINNEKLEIYI